MKTLFIEATEDSPKVFLDPFKGQMFIGGRSYFEDPVSFYDDIVDWLRRYMMSPQPKNTVEFEFEYFNSSSELMIVRLLGELNKYFIMGHNFEIIWRYDSNDEDMADIGEDFSNIFDIPIKLQVLA